MADKEQSTEAEVEILEGVANPSGIDIYVNLSQIDVGPFMEKTLQKHNYVSWIHAIQLAIQDYGYDFSWHVHTNDQGLPYFKTDWNGAMVCVSVTINGFHRTQWHPVITHTNKPIEAPSSMQINNAIQRCLTKCIALHGLGLYIYAGEDLPPTQENPNREPEAHEKQPATPAAPAPPTKTLKEARQEKLNHWVKKAVEKGLHEEDAWMIWEASRIGLKHPELDYWDEKVSEAEFQEILGEFGNNVKKELERLKK